MTEGVKGGSDNRPGSKPEIEKLPRERCVRCGIRGCAPMVVNSACTNKHACFRRVDRARRAKEAKR